MNTVREPTKEWRLPPHNLQSPTLVEGAEYQSMDHHATTYAHSFSQGHSSLHAQVSSASTRPAVEKEPRLPGMMASISQPNTPRPSPSSTESAPQSTVTSPTTRNPPSYLPTRKRSRSDSLFSPEAGPLFSPAKIYNNLYAFDRTTLLSVQLQSRMDRGFFMAENDWTCYRRNYFQVSSAFALYGPNRYYIEQGSQCFVRAENGALYNVRRFLLGISARVSNSDKAIELVQHTPKRDKGPQTTPQPKPITPAPGGDLSMSTMGTNQNIVTFERIQFKTATANNGKRRAAQQYYVCVVDLYAETETGERVKVATSQSAPLVVRGRSPGHYADTQERTANHPPAPQPPSPPQQQQPQHEEQHRYGFPRPPYTPPGMMPGEYGHSYQYYPSFGPSVLPPTMMMSNAPPTPTQHTPTSASQQHPYPYMLSGISSPGSSSSPHVYNGEFAVANNNSGAIHHDEASHPSTPGNTNSEMPVDPSAAAAAAAAVAVAADWPVARSRMNSSSSTQQASYFTPSSSQTSAFSPTTPYVDARKYNSVNNICNQQAS